jgi:hypothetical protein
MKNGNGVTSKSLAKLLRASKGKEVVNYVLTKDDLKLRREIAAEVFQEMFNCQWPETLSVKELLTLLAEKLG